MPASTTRKIFKWPLSIFVLAIVLLEMSMYIVVRILIKYLESFCRFCNRDKDLLREISKTKSYEEYVQISKKLDEFEPRKSWIDEDDSRHYNHKKILKIIKDLEKDRKDKNYQSAMNNIELYFLKRRKEYEIEQIYSSTYFHTKKLVRTLWKTLKEIIEEIENAKEIPMKSKVKFFEKIVKENGESALCFSGGANLTFFHFGVLCELMNKDLVPSIIAGTSGGAFIASYFAIRTKEELVNVETDFEELSNGLWSFNINRLLKKGHFLDDSLLTQRIKKYCLGDITFMEAFKKTRKVLNIAVTQREKLEESVVLNYRNAPNVCIWSAIMASGALPKVLPTAQLYAKLPSGEVKPYGGLGNYWVDGSLLEDVPVKALREKLNVTFTIVSQANLHVTPFAFENEGSSGLPTIHRSGEGLRGGFLLSGTEIFLRKDMQKWMIVMDKIGLSPYIYGYNFSKLLSQKYSGTVTIYAKPVIKDYIGLLGTLTSEEIRSITYRGKTAVWPKIGIVSNRLHMEGIIKKALARTKKELKRG